MRKTLTEKWKDLLGKLIVIAFLTSGLVLCGQEPAPQPDEAPEFAAGAPEMAVPVIPEEPNRQPPPPRGRPGRPGGPGRQGRPGRPGGPGMMGPRRGGPGIREILEHLKTEDPEKYEELIRLQKTDRNKFMQEIRPYAAPWETTVTAKAMASDRECRELAIKIRQTEDAEEKATLTAELERKVDESYALVVADFEQRLQRLQRNLENLRNNADENKKRRIEALLNGDPDYPGRRPGGAPGMVPPPPPPPPEE